MGFIGLSWHANTIGYGQSLWTIPFCWSSKLAILLLNTFANPELMWQIPCCKHFSHLEIINLFCWYSSSKDVGKVKILSGPNASGKSVYLKMVYWKKNLMFLGIFKVGVVVYMACCGSFVPAQRATIGPINRILSRLYTIDSVLDGMSSFANDLKQVWEIWSSIHSLSIKFYPDVEGNPQKWSAFIVDNRRIRQRHNDGRELDSYLILI